MLDNAVAAGRIDLDALNDTLRAISAGEGSQGRRQLRRLLAVRGERLHRTRERVGTTPTDDHGARAELPTPGQPVSCSMAPSHQGPGRLRLPATTSADRGRQSPVASARCSVRNRPAPRQCGAAGGLEDPPLHMGGDHDRTRACCYPRSDVRLKMSGSDPVFGSRNPGFDFAGGPSAQPPASLVSSYWWRATRNTRNRTRLTRR